MKYQREAKVDGFPNAQVLVNECWMKLNKGDDHARSYDTVMFRHCPWTRRTRVYHERTCMTSS